MSKRAIYLANTEASIAKVCQLIGMSTYELGYNTKMYCPFGDVSHSDMGQTKSFRVYVESNSAYCFACGEKYTPVKLVALTQDISEDDAADYLLEFFQITGPSVEDKWEALTAPPTFEVNASDLAESLKRFCARLVSDWETRQFEPDVSEALSRCLGLIHLIRSEDDVEMWRTAAKTEID